MLPHTDHFIDLQTLFAVLDNQLLQHGSLVIAIDGRCGGGKTTLSSQLKHRFHGVVISADDFFLRPEQRTPERFAEPGGNMDRERLAEEVLRPIRQKQSFSYRPFDCHTLSLGEPIAVEPAPLVIVEGSYSCHPELWDYYDFRIFVDVAPAEQIRRITLREGTEKAKQFQVRWIPLEEAYFSQFHVQERCDAIIRI